MNIVLDTNVLISGLLISESNPGQIVQLVASGFIKLCYDSRIITEYYNVMSRPKFSFNKEHIQDLLTQIKSQGKLVSAEPLNIKLIDSDDIKFLEVALKGKIKYLVTGNIKHYPKSKYKNINIITPSDFIKKL